MTRLLVALMLLVGQSSVFGQESAQKLAAANGYMEVAFDMQLVVEFTEALLQSVPPDRKDAVANAIRTYFSTDRYKTVAINAMVATFSASEMDALTNVYATPEGASAMRKMGAYARTVIPLLTRDIQQFFSAKPSE
jgi:hypothetical protein